MSRGGYCPRCGNHDLSWSGPRYSPDFYNDESGKVWVGCLLYSCRCCKAIVCKERALDATLVERLRVPDIPLGYSGPSPLFPTLWGWLTRRLGLIR